MRGVCHCRVLWSKHDRDLSTVRRGEQLDFRRAARERRLAAPGRRRGVPRLPAQVGSRASACQARRAPRCRAYLPWAGEGAGPPRSGRGGSVTRTIWTGRHRTPTAIARRTRCARALTLRARTRRGPVDRRVSQRRRPPTPLRPLRDFGRSCSRCPSRAAGRTAPRPRPARASMTSSASRQPGASSHSGAPRPSGELLAAHPDEPDGAAKPGQQLDCGLVDARGNPVGARECTAERGDRAVHACGLGESPGVRRGGPPQLHADLTRSSKASGLRCRAEPISCRCFLLCHSGKSDGAMMLQQSSAARQV